MQLSSEKVFQLLVSETAHSLVDVRSEKEFAKGMFPGSVNIPILKDEHRHLVGLTYKQEGQAKAVQFGHDLVLPFKPNLVRRWQETLTDAPHLVMCWRGGLRSEIACSWLKEAGAEVVRVEGGYKALRSQALRALEDLPPVLVLAGYTGSRKTELLLETQGHIDLEGLAAHRGSAFGHHIAKTQPQQATFENILGTVVARSRNAPRPILIEDEGNHLGNCFFPPNLTRALQSSDVIWLEVDLAERIQNVFEDYVLQPLAEGVHETQLAERYLAALLRIKTKLGGAMTSALKEKLAAAFDAGMRAGHSVTLHGEWIGPLLANYYDARYQFACDRLERNVIFRGDEQAVRGFLKARGYL